MSNMLGSFAKSHKYLLLLVMSFVLWGVGYVGAGALSNVFQLIPLIDERLSLAIGAILMAIIFLVINKFCFKGRVPVAINTHGLGRALLLGIPMYAAIIWNAMGAEGTDLALSTIAVSFLDGLVPGIIEEMAFRAFTIPYGMKAIKKEHEILFIAVLSSLAFGAVHLMSLINSFDPRATAFLVISCLGTGMLFSAVYLRTGSILAPILFHTLFDTAAGLAIGEGVSVLTIGGVDVTLLIMTAILVPYSLFLLRRSKRTEIFNSWKEKLAEAGKQK